MFKNFPICKEITTFSVVSDVSAGLKPSIQAISIYGHLMSDSSHITIMRQNISNSVILIRLYGVQCRHTVFMVTLVSSLGLVATLKPVRHQFKNAASFIVHINVFLS